MATSPSEPDGPNYQPPDAWNPHDDRSMGPTGVPEPGNGSSLPADEHLTAQDNHGQEYHRSSSAGAVSVSGSKFDSNREKQVKPNKVYVGGLPEHTRQEDLQSCFGQIGRITNIELKIGYGFVEFDSREAAEESVARYHEGQFMGKKIRVELSHGGGRTAKFAGDPGACFKCGDMGHWARECPNNTAGPHSRRPPVDPPFDDRVPRDYPPPPRSYPPPRDDFGPPSRYPPRDPRYDYPPVPRDTRRPPSPRDYRDYPPQPPPGGGRVRDYEDYRRPPPSLERERYAPPPPPPDMRSRYPPEPGYRPYGGPPPLPPPGQHYARYDRRPVEHYPPPPPQYMAPPPGRGRTPPRGREDFDRLPPPPPPREYPDYRGRPVTPPGRYAPDYPRPNDVEPVPTRYRRRSASPRPGPVYDSPYGNGPPPGFHMNGYSEGGPRPPGPPPRGGAPRDYPPVRNGRDPVEQNGGGYRRP